MPPKDPRRFQTPSQSPEAPIRRPPISTSQRASPFTPAPTTAGSTSTGSGSGMSGSGSNSPFQFCYTLISEDPKVSAAPQSNSSLNLPFRPPTSILGSAAQITSPPKKTNVQAIQSLISSLRDELVEMIRRIEDRVSMIEDQLDTNSSQITSIRDDLGQATHMTKSSLDAMNDRIGELAESVGNKQDRELTVAVRSPAVQYGHARWRAITSIVRKTVNFLYDWHERGPLPDYPETPEEWPRFHNEDGSLGSQCLRFDWTEPVNHIRNARGIEGIVSFLLNDRAAWPASVQEIDMAGEVPPEAFREAAKNYYISLKRSRPKEQYGRSEEFEGRDCVDQEELLDMEEDENRRFAGDFSGVDSQQLLGILEQNGQWENQDEVNSLTLQDFEHPPNDMPSQVSVGKPSIGAGSSVKGKGRVAALGGVTGLNVKSLRARRSANVAECKLMTQLANVVKNRRPHVEAFKGQEYEILDEIHSQVSEEGAGAGRVFVQERWMSEEPTSETSVVERPSWPMKNPDRYLQRWQLSNEFYEAQTNTRYWDIVPVDRPTPFVVIRSLPWYVNHPKRQSGLPLSTSAASTNLKRTRDATELEEYDDDNDPSGGLDDGPGRPQGRTSASRSPSKRPTPLP
ncbi:hypothetical protein TREMEDRAFT_66122 [Tremella mesenterica DSM 1558]|uniref:uncharacterized protein n=1 Tax=Tremella mesenterica (strain ATCC 24925 / CBS 8224 / DSM 1558 / NBRC 9311 / NRRL Y-6157 / RJB 2259-6 / UBC 559-6) TaxID=578456 RepID=UPI00032C2CC7|nr:uncharacterized protein TREMEDRAFT_66122 [Tremella mesenterica DSM 1558]EIW65747.1 hypothetical protein TREMEDRAFT_66122 [Tremella mesenterica DSM 1558]